MQHTETSYILRLMCCDLTISAAAASLTWCFDEPQASMLAALSALSMHSRTGSRQPGAASATEAANTPGHTTRTYTAAHHSSVEQTYYESALGCSAPARACIMILSDGRSSMCCGGRTPLLLLLRPATRAVFSTIPAHTVHRQCPSPHSPHAPCTSPHCLTTGEPSYESHIIA